jgi:drug/metabolite transporter (DMT)-like permease
MIALRLDGRSWALLIALSVLWAGSFLFAKIAVIEIAPASLVGLRVSLAAAVLAVYVRVAGHAWPRDGRFWRAALVMGLLNNVVPFALLFWAQQRLDAGLAAILNATTPLWTIMLAHVLTRDERLGPRRVIGVGIGIGGVVVLVGWEALRGAGDHLAEQLAVIGATLSYAFGVIWGRRFAAMAPAVPATAQLACAALIAVPLAAIIDAPWAAAAPSAKTWAAVVALALFSTALAYVIYFRLIQTSGAGNAALVTMLIPPSAMIMGALVLGERPGGDALAGLALIVAGLLIVDGRALAALRRARSF